jgi:hypothetical protein
MMLDEAGEGVVEAASFVGERTFGEGDVNAEGAEFGDAVATDERIGIDCGDDAAGDSGGDESVCTRACAALVRAGFQRDVCGCAANVMVLRCGLLEGDDLGVVACVVVMRAFAEDGFAARDDAANGRVRRSETYR